MKKLLLLFAALLVAGCGEKSSSEGSKSVREKPAASSESAESSSDTAKRAPAEPPVAESPSEEPSDTPNSLSDADVGGGACGAGCGCGAAPEAPCSVPARAAPEPEAGPWTPKTGRLPEGGSGRPAGRSAGRCRR